MGINWKSCINSCLKLGYDPTVSYLSAVSTSSSSSRTIVTFPQEERQFSSYMNCNRKWKHNTITGSLNVVNHCTFYNKKTEVSMQTRFMIFFCTPPFPTFTTSVCPLQFIHLMCSLHDLVTKLCTMCDKKYKDQIRPAFYHGQIKWHNAIYLVYVTGRK